MNYDDEQMNSLHVETTSNMKETCSRGPAVCGPPDAASPPVTPGPAGWPWTALTDWSTTARR